MLESFLPSYFQWWHLPVIFIAGLIGEGYGTIIGGGSIVMQGVMIFLGVPLQSAIATDNAGALGTEVGILSETRKKVVENKKLAMFMVIPVFLGGVVGTSFLLTIPSAVIKYLMIIAISCLLFYSLFLKNKLKIQLSIKYQYPILFILLFLIGIYNNFIGIGEGTFTKISIMLILGTTFIKSHGIKTAAMIPSRIYSLVITALSGLIIWPYLLVFWVSTFISGKYATKFITLIPERYLKLGLVTLSIIFIFALIFVY